MGKLFRSWKTDQARERRNVSTRTTRPAHLLFKIDTFTKLYKIHSGPHANVENYESPEFECGGHKWKLSLYPCGNKKLGGNGYISLYLVTSEAGIDSFDAEGICAMFKLFIFDQKRERYLTVQDDEVRKFYSLKKEWGFTRMISLKDFKNVKNGYLVDDCCVFGVEILVIPRVVKSASFSLIRLLSSGPFIWKVGNVSSAVDQICYSAPFTVHHHQWKLTTHVKQDDIKLFLVLHEPLENSKVYVRFSLEVKNSNSSRHDSLFDGWSNGSHDLVIWRGTFSDSFTNDSFTFEVTIQEMSVFITT